MCTVTLTTSTGGESQFILTSNRDEAVARKTLPPQIYNESGVRVLYPKDAVAGGTWVGVSERKRAACLLNGAFEKHERNLPYAKSRGVVVKELLAAAYLRQEVEHCSLEEVEPFTCIVVDWKIKLKFFELIWDGKSKHFRELPPGNYIWASSFLFSAESRRNRQQQFENFQKKSKVTAESLLAFHSSEEEEGMIMDKGLLKTCSITQIRDLSGGAEMYYLDLLDEDRPEYKKPLQM